MAKNTNLDLRNQVIYQVFPRQYSKENNFKGVTKDLQRIKDLGTDIVYLLPIHPIGVKNKKGDLGCPYSIQDYRKICQDLGTFSDFEELINKTHELGMKLMIDVVYNHTSRDSRLLNEHPEYFYKNKQGEFANRVGEWWDVTDLDYSNKELWKELIDTLCFWAKLGVDGFRCDVATLVPLEFWKEARKALLEVNPNFILLAESVEHSFIKYIRECGFEAASDCELYEAFDILYDYDIYSYYLDYLKNRKNLNVWLNELNKQQTTYPKNYIKSHCLENHDQVRSAAFVKDEVRLRNLDALIYFLRGTTFIYNGQEALDEVQQSLFDIDLVNWDNLGKYDIPSLMRRCSEIKKDPLFKESNYDIILEELEVAHLKYENDEEIMEIILNVGNVEGSVKVSLPDDKYHNLFDDEVIEIKESLVKINKNPLVIKCNK
jgi:glycosidase